MDEKKKTELGMDTRQPGTRRGQTCPYKNYVPGEEEKAPERRPRMGWEKIDGRKSKIDVKGEIRKAAASKKERTVKGERGLTGFYEKRGRI